jgi:NitT/TauT family transport system permease protein
MKASPDIALPAASGATEFDRQRATQARRTEIRKIIDRAIAIMVPLVLWQLASDHWVGKKWISSPIDIAGRIWSMLIDGSLQIHTWETFKEALLGLLIGTLLGLVFGIVLGLWRRLSDALDPIIMGFYSLPRVSLAPLFIIWLGIGLVAKVALVASMVVFVVLFNVREGVRNIDRDIIDAFRSMNASRSALMRYVIIPSLIPWLLTAVRIGIGMALVGAVVGELIGSSKGLGWYVSFASGVYDMTGAITALTVLMILAMVFNGILVVLEKRVMGWRRTNDASLQT